MYEQLQADLVFMDISQNDNCTYLLTVIDVLSKYAWVVPLKDKTGKSVTEAFETILKKHPNLLQVNKGTEFFKSQFEKLLKSKI